MNTSSYFTITLFACFLTLQSIALKLNKNEAFSVLQRFKRANSRAEELRKRSELDRECASERCDQEEFDEIFENHVAGYRKMDGYKKNLFKAYEKCKKNVKSHDVNWIGSCIKKVFSTLPSSINDGGIKYPNNRETSIILDKIVEMG